MFEQYILDGMEISELGWGTNLKGKLVQICIGKSWKLGFKCVHCGKIDNCWCYSSKEKMLLDRARYANHFFCSLECEVKHMSTEEQQLWVKIRMEEFCTHWGDNPKIDWNDLDAVIEFVGDMWSDAYDPWEPEGADEDCSM